MVTVRIINYEKFKGRSDVKINSWFRCSNRLLEDHEFFDFTHEELLVWIYLLSVASQKNTADITLSHRHAEQVCRLSPPSVDSAIKKLKQLNVIEIFQPRTVRGRYVRGTSTCATVQDSTVQDTTTQDRLPSDPPPPAPEPDKVLNQEIWKSYAEAYQARYKTAPVRNAKVNGQVAQLAKRLGSEAPAVVHFYVGHNKAFYVSKVHDLGLCLSDAEALRTQWATDTKVTQRQAQQADDSAALGSQLQRIREGKI